MLLSALHSCFQKNTQLGIRHQNGGLQAKFTSLNFILFLLRSKFSRAFDATFCNQLKTSDFKQAEMIVYPRTAISTKACYAPCCLQPYLIILTP